MRVIETTAEPGVWPAKRLRCKGKPIDPAAAAGGQAMVCDIQPHQVCGCWTTVYFRQPGQDEDEGDESLNAAIVEIHLSGGQTYVLQFSDAKKAEWLMERINEQPTEQKGTPTTYEDREGVAPGGIFS